MPAKQGESVGWTAVDSQTATKGDLTMDYIKEWQFVTKIQKLIQDSLSLEAQRHVPVIRFKDPEQLKKDLNLTLGMKPESLSELVKLCDEVVNMSVKTGHPYFLNQHYGACDPYGLAASYLIDSLNTNVYTFDIGPVLTLIEMEVVRIVSEIVGIPDAEGTFCPGGSMCNMYAINLSRFLHNKAVKKTGIFNSDRLLIFASEESHYSVTKGAAFTGFGTDSIIYVPCDALGNMIPNELEKAIERESAKPGQIPLLVWCTVGSTVLAGVDPLDAIATICQKYKLWMHADAVHGAMSLVSKTQRKYLSGIEKCDSVAWNWHKIIGAPLQTSIFITKHKGLLKECHGANADYLFQKEKHYDTAYDSGDASLQCSRRPEALKVWLIVKGRGLEGLETLCDATFENAEYLYGLLSKNKNFKMVLPQRNLTTVCFWLVPKYLQGKPEDEYFWDQLSKLAPKLKRKMVDSGLVMLSFSSLPNKKLPSFFRITLKFHPLLSHEDLEKIVDTIASVTDDVTL